MSASKPTPETLRYLDEQAFRFNERFGNDGDRFETVMKQIVNKRVTYKQLTGKSEELPADTPEGF